MSLASPRRATTRSRALIPGGSSRSWSLGVRCSAASFILGGLFLTSLAPAQPLSPETISTRSVSGQFIVQASGSPGLPILLAPLGTNRNFVLLEPKLVPTSCERIKQFLWRELAVSGPWRGKIFLTLRPAKAADDTVTIFSEQYTDGWQYRVDLPNVLERTRYVRAIVQVLLLEMANRSADTRSAEIPFWLTEGFTHQLLASRQIEIILPPPQQRASGLGITVNRVDARREDPLESAHNVLLSHASLSFQDLSWPAPDQLTGPAGELYASSAQLFVSELQRLKDGPACLRAMLEELPRHYNWQFAFLHAFRAFFQRPLEVEKWWALQLAQFTGRDLAQTWPADESWQKLDQVIRSSVQIRTGTNDMPLRADVPLQTIIREWDLAPQTQALQKTLRELEMLRLCVATNHVALVDDYHQVLQTYLQNRDRKGLIPFRGEAVRRHAATEALQQLDLLEARRMALAPSETRRSLQTATKPGPQ